MRPGGGSVGKGAGNKSWLQELTAIMVPAGSKCAVQWHSIGDEKSGLELLDCDDNKNKNNFKPFSIGFNSLQAMHSSFPAPWVDQSHLHLTSTLAHHWFFLCSWLSTFTGQVSALEIIQGDQLHDSLNVHTNKHNWTLESLLWLLGVPVIRALKHLDNSFCLQTPSPALTEIPSVIPATLWRAGRALLSKSMRHANQWLIASPSPWRPRRQRYKWIEVWRGGKLVSPSWQYEPKET